MITAYTHVLHYCIYSNDQWKRKKAGFSYHSTATVVFSRIFVTLSPPVPRNLLIHVAANEDVSQLPEIITSPVDSCLINLKSHPDWLIRLMRANPIYLGGSLSLHLNRTSHATLNTLNHLLRTLTLCPVYLCCRKQNDSTVPILKYVIPCQC